jgi:hypothetical protein
LVFFQAVKSDLNNVWMTKNNPHRPCLTKKGSTLWSEYKSSLSSTGGWKWSTTSTDVWKWSTPSNRSIAIVTMLSRPLCPGNYNRWEKSKQVVLQVYWLRICFLSEIWVKNGELSIAFSKANIVATIV